MRGPAGTAVVNQATLRVSCPGGLPSSRLRPAACALRLPCTEGWSVMDGGTAVEDSPSSLFSALPHSIVLNRLPGHAP